MTTDEGLLFSAVADNPIVSVLKTRDVSPISVISVLKRRDSPEKRTPKTVRFSAEHRVRRIECRSDWDEAHRPACWYVCFRAFRLYLRASRVFGPYGLRPTVTHLSACSRRYNGKEFAQFAMDELDRRASMGVSSTHALCRGLEVFDQDNEAQDIPASSFTFSKDPTQLLRTLASRIVLNAKQNSEDEDFIEPPTPEEEEGDDDDDEVNHQSFF